MTAHIFGVMDTSDPARFNEQHIWGGNTFHQQNSFNSDASGQPTLVGRHEPVAAVSGSASSQTRIIASSSDDLFHPASGGPPSHSYFLPPVPFHHDQPISQIPVNRDHLSQPQHNSFPYYSLFSSYNNPSFQVPSSSQQNSQPSSESTQSFVPPISTSNSTYNHPSQLNQQGPSSIPYMQSNYHPVSPAYIPPLNQNPYHNYSFNPPVSFPYAHYAPPPLPSAPMASMPKALPSVTHIPILTNKHDFFAWDEGVTSLLRATGLLGHILDPLEALDPTRPDCFPVLLPTLLTTPTQPDIEAFTRWWDDDNAAQHVLVSRIGTIPRGLIPSSTLVARTALSIYQMLV